MYVVFISLLKFPISSSVSLSLLVEVVLKLSKNLEANHNHLFAHESVGQWFGLLSWWARSGLPRAAGDFGLTCLELLAGSQGASALLHVAFLAG